MTTAERLQIRERMQYGDLRKAHKVITQANVVNQRTEREYSYQTLQRQVLGLLDNPALWEALERITAERAMQARKIRHQPVAEVA